MKNKKNKKTVKKTGFLRYRPMLAMLLVIMVAAIGYAAYRHVHAATQPSVQFVILCPDDGAGHIDNSHCKISVSKANAIGRNVRHWYGRQLGGKTFRMAKTIKVKGNHVASWYDNGSSDPANNVWNNVASEGKVQYNDNKIAMVILGWNAFGNTPVCGLTDLVQHMGVIDNFVQFPYQGGTITCRGTTYIKETFAHELGHAFGLNHRCDGTIMTGGNSCNASLCGGKAFSKCDMASAQRSFLLNNRSAWFTRSKAVTSASGTYFQPADADEDQPYSL